MSNLPFYGRHPSILYSHFLAKVFQHQIGFLWWCAGFSKFGTNTYKHRSITTMQQQQPRAKFSVPKAANARFGGGSAFAKAIPRSPPLNGPNEPLPSSSSQPAGGGGGDESQINSLQRGVRPTNPKPQLPSAVRPEPWTWYKRIETIGAGAFGIAYLASGVPHLNGGLAGYYVVKRIFLQGTDEVLKSAAVEVRVLEMISHHTNIVDYYTHFVDAEGYINIVMEYCPGGDLDQLMAQRRSAGIPFRLEEVLFIAFQLISAVRHLHALGVVHRDLKPSNIFLCASSEEMTVPRDSAKVVTPDAAWQAGTTHRERLGTMGVGGKKTLLGVALKDITGLTMKIADFGISKVLESTHAQAKTVIGTPFYISPELCNGEPYSSGADIWALGCILYEVASTGLKCFPGDNMIAIVRRICSEQVPHIPDFHDEDAQPPTGSSASKPAQQHQAGLDGFPVVAGAATLAAPNKSKRAPTGPLKPGPLNKYLRPLLLAMLEPTEEDRPSAESLLRSFFLPDAGGLASEEGAKYADDFEDPEEDELEWEAEEEG